jgi:hypothetical protein
VPPAESCSPETRIQKKEGDRTGMWRICFAEQLLWLLFILLHQNKSRFVFLARKMECVERERQRDRERERQREICK